MAKQIKCILTVLWVLIWACVAGIYLTTRHGTPALRNPIGPTLVSDKRPQPFNFAVLGDCHANRKVFRELELSIKAQEKTVDFVIQLGDFVDFDEPLEYHHFLNRIGTPTLPLFFTRGNHEAIDFQLDESDYYKQLIPDSTYSFEHKGCLFLILDTSHGTASDADFSTITATAQNFRLRQPAGQVFLFTHYPPSTNESGSYELTPDLTKRILDFCDEHRVDHLFCGHLHLERNVCHNQTTIMINGCGGGSMHAPSTSTNFILAEIKGDDITTTTVPLGRDHTLISRLDYLFGVTLFRYRWFTVSGALMILLFELVHFLRKRKTC